MIPYGRQDIQQSDIDAVLEVLGSDYLTQGPKVPDFEHAIADYTGAKHAVAVNSATSALHIACLALGLGEGGLLWTSPITFVASANCARYCNADVDFVDIDPESFNMCPMALEKKLITARQANRLPDIVIPVALCGQSCDMAAIRNLSNKFGFKIIEDASHAIGATYKNKPIGIGDFADISIFSFHPVKIITTAEGGAAVTNNADLAENMQLLRSHGVTRDSNLMDQQPDGPWYYQQVDLGFNYRMTEIQAALGISQMSRLDEYVARRQVICNRYDKLLASFPIDLPRQLPDSNSARHLYVIRVDPRIHRTVFEQLRRLNLGVNLHYIPVHMQPYYKKLGFAKGDFPNAEAYYARAISIPVYATMSDGQQDQVVAAIHTALDTVGETI